MTQEVEKKLWRGVLEQGAVHDQRAQLPDGPRPNTDLTALLVGALLAAVIYWAWCH